MDKIEKTLTVVVLLVCVYVCFVFFFSKPIMKNSFFSRGVRNLIELLAAPRDLYIYFVKKPVNVNVNSKTTFEFKNVYIGKTEVDLLMKNCFEDFSNKKNSTQLKLKLVFFIDAKPILERIVKNPFDPFVASDNGDNGVVLTTYNCPEELPMDKLVKCEITVMNPDPALSKRYGNIQIGIRRGLNIITP